MIDENGYRLNVGIILVGPQHNLFLAKRIGQDAWQFPQGGLQQNEQPKDALYRELEEEVGLRAKDVKCLTESHQWLSYKLPKHLIRQQNHPLCIGQKQKWFVLKLMSPDSKIRLDLSPTPEFDSWRWVDYWFPLNVVIAFKRHVYRQALREFSPIVFANEKTKAGYRTR